MLWTPQDDGDGAYHTRHAKWARLNAAVRHAGVAASAAPDDANPPSVGDLLRVTGRITSYCGQVQLNCTSYGAGARAWPAAAVLSACWARRGVQ